MKSYLIKLSTLGFVGLCILGCATTRTGISVLEGPKEYPSWVDKPDAKSTKTHKAFCGESRKHYDRVDAIRFARENAMSKALQDIWGVLIKQRVKKVFEDAGLSGDLIPTDIANIGEDKWKAEGIVKGDEIEVCAQRIEERDPSGETKVYWRAYALFLFDRNMAKQALEEALSESKKSALDETKRKQLEKGFELIDKIGDKLGKEW